MTNNLAFEADLDILYGAIPNQINEFVKNPKGGGYSQNQALVR